VEDRAIQYVAGGTVQAGAGLYIERAADKQLLDLCSSGAFAYVLSSRQVGKSSLLIRTAERLLETGTSVAVVDLTQLGVNIVADQWYVGFLSLVADQIDVPLDVGEWWRAKAELSFTQRLVEFFTNVVPNRVFRRIVIFVDEIDTTLSLPFADDFFISIRYLYNGRAMNPELARLSFVLIGVATPNDLIRDPQRTPFNIGTSVELTDFTEDEAMPLTEGLNLSQDQAATVLRRVLYWTAGHPYLTLRTFRSLADNPPEKWNVSSIDERVRDLFIEHDHVDSNLQFVRDMLVWRANSTRPLQVYRAVLKGRNVADTEPDEAFIFLKIAGVVRVKNGKLRVRNRIYQTTFDLRWVSKQVGRLFWPDRRQVAIGAAIGVLTMAAILVLLASLDVVAIHVR
jgi:hypothetical protein